jgi:hypothetical protein
MTVDRFEWERAVRALPIRPPVRKLVGLMLATYANKDGSNAHPGEDRLAADCGLTERAVRGHLAALRDDLGLIERTYRGSQSGRRKLADEYALRVPADVVARLQHRNAASGDAAQHRNDGSCVQAPISGISASDHRNLSADHRNLSAWNTGTVLPPTKSNTKDADHTSPTQSTLAASATGVDGRSAKECPGCGTSKRTRDGDCVGCNFVTVESRRFPDDLEEVS